MRKRTKPCFITLEGTEGSGKSSQLGRIVEFFQERGEAVIATREPGGTEIADQIRRILVEAHGETLEPMAELLLYNASRIQHLSHVVRPALAEGKTVLCDRYTDATIAYQAYGRQLPLGTVGQINDWATGGLKPDLTLLLDCDPKIGIERSMNRLQAEASRETRFEEEALAFHQRVRKGYLELADHQKDRFAIIDANSTPDDVFASIRKVLEEKL